MTARPTSPPRSGRLAHRLESLFMFAVLLMCIAPTVGVLSMFLFPLIPLFGISMALFGRPHLRGEPATTLPEEREREAPIGPVGSPVIAPPLAGPA